MSSFGDAIDRVDEERKIRQIQSKYKLINEKYTNLKNQNIKV